MFDQHVVGVRMRLHGGDPLDQKNDVLFYFDARIAGLAECAICYQALVGLFLLHKRQNSFTTPS